MFTVPGIFTNSRRLKESDAAWLPGTCRRAAWALSLVLVGVTGCNPAMTAAKLGVRLIGQAIEDGDVRQRGQALVGHPAAAADEMFGTPIDVFKDVRSEQRWRSYPVKLDVLGRQRYVVAVSGGRIVSVSKAEKSSRKVDLPRTLILKEKVKHASPHECEARLGLGRPLLAARSEKTNCLIQLYNAGMATDLGTPHYCIVRFDENDRCEDLDFVAVGASTRSGM